MLHQFIELCSSINESLALHDYAYLSLMGVVYLYIKYLGFKLNKINDCIVLTDKQIADGETLEEQILLQWYILATIIVLYFVTHLLYQYNVLGIANL